MAAITINPLRSNSAETCPSTEADLDLSDFAFRPDQELAIRQAIFHIDSQFSRNVIQGVEEKAREFVRLAIFDSEDSAASALKKAYGAFIKIKGLATVEARIERDFGDVEKQMGVLSLRVTSMQAEHAALVAKRNKIHDAELEAAVAEDIDREANFSEDPEMYAAEQEALKKLGMDRLLTNGTIAPLQLALVQADAELSILRKKREELCDDVESAGFCTQLAPGIGPRFINEKSLEKSAMDSPVVGELLDSIVVNRLALGVALKKQADAERIFLSTESELRDLNKKIGDIEAFLGNPETPDMDVVGREMNREVLETMEFLITSVESDANNLIEENRMLTTASTSLQKMAVEKFVHGIGLAHFNGNLVDVIKNEAKRMVYIGIYPSEETAELAIRSVYKQMVQGLGQAAAEDRMVAIIKAHTQTVSERRAMAITSLAGYRSRLHEANNRLQTLETALTEAEQAFDFVNRSNLAEYTHALKVKIDLENACNQAGNEIERLQSKIGEEEAFLADPDAAVGLENVATMQFLLRCFES